MKPSHTAEGKLFHSNCRFKQSHLEISFQKHLEKYLAKYVGTSVKLTLTTTCTSYLYLEKGRDFAVLVKMSEEEEEHRYNEISLWKCCVRWSQEGEEKKVDLKLRVLMCFLF